MIRLIYFVCYKLIECSYHVRLFFARGRNNALREESERLQRIVNEKSTPRS
jgi:hypothetical protein